MDVATKFEICVVKGAELDDKDPRNIFKGRALLDGSWVKDENYDVALFNEMGLSPATIQAGKAVDVFGLQPGYAIEQADAEALEVITGMARWAEGDWRRSGSPLVQTGEADGARSKPRPGQPADALERRSRQTARRAEDSESL